MRQMLLATLLLLSTSSYAQSLWSNNPSDFGWAAHKSFLFYIARDGKEYMKVFTCGNTVQNRMDGAVLLCEGGFGETWAVYFTGSFGIYNYLFTQGNSTTTPIGSTVYMIRYNGTSFEGHYAESLQGGMTAYQPLTVRNVDIEKPTYAADLLTPVSMTVDPVVYNATTGILELPVVWIGAARYSVVMKQTSVGTTGPYQFTVTSAVKK